MLYDEKYKGMKPVEEARNIIYGHKERPCIICGRMTRYIEINYEAHFCSEECLKEMDKTYLSYLGDL